VDLFDLSGRRVRNLADRVLPAGATVLPWDGRDDAGKAMPRGVYFARLTGSGLSATARILLAPR
jgi:flagellar hook assembly protein FlgD